MDLKLIISCALLAAASGALAQEGSTVARDATTGKLRAPTAAELRELRNAAPRQPQLAEPRPQSSVRPDGTRSLRLGERGLIYSTVQRSPDGTLTRRCSKDGALIEQGKENDHAHH